MMGVGELAGAAVALVGPYVAKGAEELAKKVGGEVGGRVVKLWDTLKAKLAGKEALADVEAKPDDQRRWSALELQLEKVFEADPGFREAVAKLINEIPEEKRAAIQQIVNVTGDRNVTTEIAGSANQVNVGRP
jgi:hypothetical protein